MSKGRRCWFRRDLGDPDSLAFLHSGSLIVNKLLSIYLNIRLKTAVKSYTIRRSSLLAFTIRYQLKTLKWKVLGGQTTSSYAYTPYSTHLLEVPIWNAKNFSVKGVHQRRIWQIERERERKSLYWRKKSQVPAASLSNGSKSLSGVFDDFNLESSNLESFRQLQRKTHSGLSASCRWTHTHSRSRANVIP